MDLVWGNINTNKFYHSRLRSLVTDVFLEDAAADIDQRALVYKNWCRLQWFPRSMGNVSSCLSRPMGAWSKIAKIAQYQIISVGYFGGSTIDLFLSEL